MTRITRIEENRVYGNWHGSVVESWVDISNIRKSTKEEVEEEIRILNDPNTFDYFSN